MQAGAATVRFERVTPAQFGDVLALLAQSGLPADGLAGHWAATLVALQAERVVGSAALELYGTAALLRSVAVAQPRRGQGIGRHLTAAALDLARAHGVRQVYLLTETAPDFFAGLGFRPVSRAAVAPAVQQSVEFVSACPQSAQAMLLDL
ncbi:MAG: GNAT family N-acetyltransferase [Caldilineaceae bacterium]|nr:GNAT family N-acetyltransferase [Caldilineaceae bacterium]